MTVRNKLKGKEAPVLKIGVIADPQFGDLEPMGVRFFRESADKLKDALQTFSGNTVDFIVNLGDMIERHFVNYETVEKIYNDFSIPYYNILGNHDFEISDENKLLLLRKYKMPDFYYHFSINNWRFIFLDGTELGAYASGIHPGLAEEGKQLREAIRGKLNDKPWNGGIGRKQQEWLRNNLREAENRNEKVLLFCHFPVLPDTIDLTLWNNEEMVSLFEESGNVFGYISGHHHEGGYILRSGIHYFIQKAMSDTHQNAFTILEVYPDYIFIKGYGNECDRVLRRQETTVFR